MWNRIDLQLAQLGRAWYDQHQAFGINPHFGSFKSWTWWSLWSLLNIPWIYSEYSVNLQHIFVCSFQWKWLKLDRWCSSSTTLHCQYNEFLNCKILLLFSCVLWVLQMTANHRRRTWDLLVGLICQLIFSLPLLKAYKTKTNQPKNKQTTLEGKCWKNYTD